MSITTTIYASDKWSVQQWSGLSSGSSVDTTVLNMFYKLDAIYDPGGDYLGTVQTYQRGFMEFNTLSIPLGAKIESVKITLYNGKYDIWNDNILQFFKGTWTTKKVVANFYEMTSISYTWLGVYNSVSPKYISYTLDNNVITKNGLTKIGSYRDSFGSGGPWDTPKLEIKYSPPPDISMNIDGTYKKYDDGWVNIDGIWRKIDSVYSNINGIWKQS